MKLRSRLCTFEYVHLQVPPPPKDLAKYKKYTTDRITPAYFPKRANLAGFPFPAPPTTFEISPGRSPVTLSR